MKDRLAAVDGLRGLAILMVTAVHLWMVGNGVAPVWFGPIDLSPYLCFGGSGVSLFFSISGFCLYHPLARATVAGKPWPTWRRFFIRRAIRILPAYWLAVAIWLPLWAHTAGWAGWLWQLASHLAFVHPLLPGCISTITPVLWSLGTEVHFYLAFPLLALLVRRRPWAVLGVCAALSVTCQLWAAYGCTLYRGMQEDPTALVLTRFLPARLFEFAAGMVAGHLAANGVGGRGWHYGAWVLGLAGLLVTPLVHWAVQPATKVPLFWWWGDVLCAPSWGALLYVTASHPADAGSRLLAWRPLATLGVISYSVYLYNLTMSVLPARLYPGVVPGSGWWWLLTFLLVVGCGGVGYLIAERPFLGLRSRLRQAAVTAAGSSG